MGLAAVALALAGVPVNAVYLARHAHTEITAPHGHHIRDLLVAAARAMPPDGRWVITSAARTPNALYLVGRPPVADVAVRGSAAKVHARLLQARVGYVIVVSQRRLKAFRTRHDEWYTVVLTRPAGQLLRVKP
jgi:hypothetical protein